MPIIFFMAQAALQSQLLWFDFLMGPPKRIRIGNVVINIEDFKKRSKV